MLSSESTSGGGAGADWVECFDDTVDRFSDVASIDLNDLAVDLDRDVELAGRTRRGTAASVR